VKIIRIEPDGRRATVTTYDDVSLAFGRRVTHTAALAAAGTGGSAVGEVHQRDDLRVYVAKAYDATGKLVATFEDEWPTREAEEAKTLFDRIDELDGCGLVVSDSDLLAEAIGRMLGVQPVEAYAEYGGKTAAEQHEADREVEAELREDEFGFDDEDDPKAKE
jgi:hypothetical protein